MLISAHYLNRKKCSYFLKQIFLIFDLTVACKGLILSFFFNDWKIKFLFFLNRSFLLFERCPVGLHISLLYYPICILTRAQFRKGFLSRLAPTCFFPMRHLLFDKKGHLLITQESSPFLCSTTWVNEKFYKSSGQGTPSPDSHLDFFYTVVLASRDEKSSLYSHSKQTKHIIKTHK